MNPNSSLFGKSLHTQLELRIKMNIHNKTQNNINAINRSDVDMKSEAKEQLIF